MNNYKVTTKTMYTSHVPQKGQYDDNALASVLQAVKSFCYPVVMQFSIKNYTQNQLVMTFL